MDLRALAFKSTTIDDLRATSFRDPSVALVIDPPAFPNLCPHCGTAANQPIAINRPFCIYVPGEGESSSETIPVIDTFQIPFCPRCQVLHQQAPVPANPWLPIRRLFYEAQGFAGFVVMLISLLFFKEAVLNFKLVPFILGLFPLLIGLTLIRPVWRKSAFLAIPPPSTVTASIDFSPSLALPHEPSFRAFTFSLAAYQQAFLQANHTRLWNPSSPQAKLAESLRNKDSLRTAWIAGIIVAIIALWLLLRS